MRFCGFVVLFLSLSMGVFAQEAQLEKMRMAGRQMLVCQRVTGGWPKNIDMVSPMDAETLEKMAREHNRTDDSTIDNGATTTQMTYLARLYHMTGESRWKDGFQRGLEYLLSGQYENGGWPQFWPGATGYHTEITFNDEAMVHVMTMLKNIMELAVPYDGNLVGETMRFRCAQAFDKGINCILKCQIIVDGEPTVWCQQHDRETLLPVKGRAYELPSFCAQESVGIVELLMSVKNKDERIERSIEGAMKWFEGHKLTGIKVVRGVEDGKYDTRVKADPTAEPTWARFYDLENCEPFFCDRDGVPRKNLSDIGDERRNGYSWYGQRPARLLEKYKEELQMRETETEHIPYSLWMVKSEMRRTAKSYLLDFSTKPKWSYVMGIELESMLDTYLRYGGGDIWNYISEYPQMMIDSLGNTRGYKYEDFNLDNIRPARFILRMYALSKRQGEERAIRQYFQQLQNQPRTNDGPFWHKKIYHDQVWLDGIYMGLPFYTKYASMGMFREGSAKEIYDDAVDQILMTDKRTYDEKTGLWKHAYDEKHEMFWADKQTGKSKHTWARAMGWYVMAMIEVLDVLPEDYTRRGEVIELFRKAMNAVVRYRDGDTGVWYDVLDVKDERNYVEATASCMFTYCLLKGARMGYLGSEYLEAGRDAYNSIIRNFIKENEDGTISLTKCCSVSGLGPESNPKRDGSFEYYMSEPVRDNDAKGVGPFIWASLEME